MNRYGKRCVLYPRVSTEMQVDGYSLEGQKNMLTRFADREEMIVVDTYEDAGKSGKSIEGRPAFQKMLRDIEDGLDIDYILVYKLSRFGRNAADILNSLELVQSYGVNLICIEEGIDSSQTSGKLDICITKISTFLILCDLAVCLATLYVSFSLVFALMRYLQGKVFLIRFYSPTTLSSSRAEFRLPSRLACA